jgi:hypothetical protein
MYLVSEIRTEEKMVPQGINKTVTFGETLGGITK